MYLLSAINSQRYSMYWHQGCVNAATVSIQREEAKVQIHICEGANAYFTNSSLKICSCICATANTTSTCICATSNSSRFFHACIGFVSGGTLGRKHFRHRGVCSDHCGICRDSIAKPFVLVFTGYRTIPARHVDTRVQSCCGENDNEGECS